MNKVIIEFTPLQIRKVIDILSGYRHDQRDDLDEDEAHLLDFIQVKLEKGYKKVNPQFVPLY
jgi:hypothetical protein